MYEDILSRCPQDGISSKKLSFEEMQLSKAAAINAIPGKLSDGVHCAVCMNRGYLAVVEEGELRTKDCACMVQRRSRRRIESSGLADSLRRCTFEAYQTPDVWQAKAKRLAESYAYRPEGWFVVSGSPGSGKTHLCTAICGKLLRDNMPVRYLQWRSDSPRLKACVNSEEYDRALAPYRSVKCLYIDDFWKGALTEADIKLSFDLLNSRYNDESKLTVISTELPIEKILSVDEAIGSRIYERSRGRYICISGENKNWRLRRLESPAKEECVK